jgi:preprotein translocase subunit SecG
VQAVLLLIHLLLAITLIIVILLQKSEGGGLGIGGGNMGGLMTARGSANLLTRATGIIAACFIVTSITLAILAGNTRQQRSIVDRPAAPIQQPVAPSGPSVPLAK